MGKPSLYMGKFSMYMGSTILYMAKISILYMGKNYIVHIPPRDGRWQTRDVVGVITWVVSGEQGYQGGYQRMRLYLAEAGDRVR